MTWPDGIALAIGLTSLALLTHTPTRRSTTQPQHRTEAGHGHPHQQHPQAGEEDHC